MYNCRAGDGVDVGKVRYMGKVKNILTYFFLPHKKLACLLDERLHHAVGNAQFNGTVNVIASRTFFA